MALFPAIMQADNRGRGFVWAALMLGHGGGGGRGGGPVFTLPALAHSNMINVLGSHVLIEDDVVKENLNREINDFIRPPSSEAGKLSRRSH